LADADAKWLGVVAHATADEDGECDDRADDEADEFAHNLISLKVVGVVASRSGR
jgi:hypothetical protein